MTTIVHIRWTLRADVPAMTAIEAATFGSWDAADFVDAHRRRDTFGLVAASTHDGRILGYAVTQIRPGVLLVANFAAVCPETRRALIDALEAKAQRHGRVLGWDVQMMPLVN